METKKEYFSWTSQSDAGQFMMIYKENLNMDSQYQRNRADIAKVRKIALNWDWRLVGAISVVKRPNNTFWVYDGGHRVAASLQRDDISELPCMVFESRGIISEAKAFMGANLLKSNVSAYHKFRASILAKEPVSLKAKEILDKYGYKPARNTKTAFGVSAIASLCRFVKKDWQRADAMFCLCAEITADGEQFPQSVMGGLFYLIGKTDVLSESWRNKLRVNGLQIIKAIIKQDKIVHGKSGTRFEGIAIANFLNKGRKKKLKIYTKNKML